MGVQKGSTSALEYECVCAQVIIAYQLLKLLFEINALFIQRAAGG